MSDRNGEPSDLEIVEDPEIVAERPTARVLEDPNTNVDPVGKNLHAYREIAYLQDINEEYPFLKLALQDWERREEFLSKRLSRWEGHSIQITNQIFSIFGIFAVFQGVVLTAVSQLKQTANKDKGGFPVCGKIWFPIALTLFVTLVTIAGILHEYATLQFVESTIQKNRHAINELAGRALRLRREGPQKFKFEKNTDNSSLATEPEFGMIGVIVIVVIFTVICILSYFVILCDFAVIKQWD